MTRISILYPNLPSSRFNFHYYTEVHMPRSIELLSAHPGFRGVSVEKGLSNALPDKEIPYIAMCHFLFGTSENFIEAFTPHAEELQGDMINYTDIEPIIQFNEVLIQQ